MERYQMNRPGCRPCYPNSNSRQQSPCYSMPANCNSNPENGLYSHVDLLPVGMAYVPYQKYQQPFDLCYALSVGTIFPDLCKPFCGRRGVRP